MPIYTYQCNSCGVRFEKHQSFQDNPLSNCPECHEDELRKVFVPAGIIFKGSGWYATDHRSPSGQTKGNGEKGESSAESKGEGEGKSDRKGESKGDSRGEGKSEGRKSESKGDSRGEGKSEGRGEGKSEKPAAAPASAAPAS